LEFTLNYVERPYGSDQRILKFSIPHELPGDVISLSDEFKLPKPTQKKYGDFSITDFFSRYLAGSKSIREARSVSRKRICLVASNIGYYEPEALEVKLQSERYQQAKTFLLQQESYKLEHLLTVHKILAPENKKAGLIRRNQNWIGGKDIDTAAYLCPPADLVPELMENLIEFLNDSRISPTIRVIAGHIHLLVIHPFNDGNGRTSRVMLEAGMEKIIGEHVNPCMNRFSKTSAPFIPVLSSMLKGPEEFKENLPYWTEVYSWGDKLYSKIDNILSNAEAKLASKLSFMLLSEKSQRLLSYLWKQPIVCEAGLVLEFKWNFFEAQEAIQSLIQANILEPRRLKNPNNAIIYDCPIVFEAWSKIDNEIFIFIDD